MIHAIPFKVVHPCPRRTAPRCHHYHQPPLVPICTGVPSPSPPRPVSVLSSLPLARSHAHARTCTRSVTRTDALSLSLSYYPPTGSLFLRVTTQWRCHTLAPSSNQCYCFIVPLLLLLLDTRKGDPSIPESVRECRGRRRFASPRLALPSRAKRYEALYGPTGARIRSQRISR